MYAFDISSGSKTELYNDLLSALDASLKRRSINPGTSADFTVATLFLDALFRGRS